MASHQTTSRSVWTARVFSAAFGAKELASAGAITAAVNAPPVLRSITAEGGHSKRFARQPETGEDVTTCSSRCPNHVAAFTLTELLVLIAVLAVFALTQLPALMRAKVPVKHTQCMNNCRQMGQAAMLYKDDNNDAYPYGNRISGPGTTTGSVVDSYGWPMQLLRYMGGYTTNVQPLVYVCPSERSLASTWVFQVHYQANRYLLSDKDDRPTGLTGAMVRTPFIYWMFLEKDPAGYCNARAGGLANPVLAAWNFPPGSPGYRRHTGGTSSAAADGHVEWLRMPPYEPGSPSPLDFGELGDCANGINSPVTWINSNRVKLFCRYKQTVTTDNPF